MFSQHRVGTPDLSWEVREDLLEKLPSRGDNEGTREVRESGPGSRAARAKALW